MLGSNPPDVHIPQSTQEEGESRSRLVEDAVMVDSPSASKFGFTWPADGRILQQKPFPSDRLASFNPPDRGSVHSLAPTTDQPTDSDTTPTGGAKSVAPTPKFSRSVSMPSQHSHFQNPCDDLSLSPLSLTNQSPEFTQFCELSLELAASVQMVVQTLLRISPPQMLDPTKEQFSACSLPVPTPTMSAVITSLKGINYMSGHMAAFCAGVLKAQQNSDNLIDFEPGGSWNQPNDFDIGELLQNVGDALSGTAANAGVDLVLFHGDVGLKHVIVKGDERGLAFALSHIIRQVVVTAKRGDSIEIGLFITPASSDSTPPDSVFDANSANRALRCTFEISHKCGAPDAGEDSPSLPRFQPIVQSLLLQRLLRHLDACLVPDVQPRAFSVGRVCELCITLDRGSPSAVLSPPIVSPADGVSSTSSESRIADEPTLEELTQFAESVRGKKATLFASTKGSFAHHLTSYLTTWGLDVSHVSREVEAEGNTDRTGAPRATEPRDLLTAKSLVSTYEVGSASPGTSSVTVEGSSQPHRSPSFLLIDDDVTVLRERLCAIQAEQPHQFNLTLRRQSTLTGSHRTRMSPGYRSPVHTRSFDAPPSVFIMHFTSLANFNSVKDIVHSFLTLHPGPSATPEVMIIPKPAGPRRLLTALHTAVTKPTVDPYFSPIATSPGSPSVLTSNQNHPRSPDKPLSTRSNSERSVRSGQGDALPSSPLRMSDGKEYFPDVKLGASPSSGFMIQSPDGQPAGIIFHPRAKAQSPTYADGQLLVPPTHKAPSPLQRLDDSVPSTSAISPILAASTPSKQPPLSVIQRPREHQESESRGAGTSTDEPSSGSLQISSPVISKLNALENIAPISPVVEVASSPIIHQRRPTPKRPSADKSSSFPTVAGKSGKGPRDANVVPPISVLIVDDNPINQTILSTFMKKKQIKYDVAKNGHEAVQKWRTGGFHLILMDIQMPIMDGIQATKEIRRLEKENANAGYPPFASQSSSAAHESRLLTSPYRSSVIIVALTASSLQSDRVAALAAGCNDFLTKPVSLLWLNNKITEWGSIKALQMWADLRPDVMKNVASGQDAKARNVAERLYLPQQGRTTPSPSRTSAGPGMSSMSSVAPNSAASPPTVFWSPTQSPAAFWNQPSLSILSNAGSQPPAEVLSSDNPSNEPDADRNVAITSHASEHSTIESSCCSDPKTTPSDAPATMEEGPH